MNRKYLALLAAALTAGAALPLHAEDAADLPLRKAGRWQLTTVMDEGFGPREQTLTMCIDANMERNTALASKVQHAKNCSLYEIKKDGDSVVVDAQCIFEGRKVESQTTMSGDFEHDFQIKISSTTSGAEHGQSITVKRTITQNGHYLGEDCADLQAGEAVGTDGNKIMVQ